MWEVTADDGNRACQGGSPRRATRAFFLVLLLVALCPPLAGAQVPPRESPGQILPPLPPAPLPELTVPPRTRVFVRRVNVVGSTVFSQEDLAKVTEPYVDRYLTAEDLEALRVEITRLYVDRGFVNSGAVLPDQTLKEGVVTYRVIEGGLTDIEISGNRWFRSGYLRRRIEVGTPLNINDLQRRIEQLLEDSRIRRLAADLKPGLRLGESVLDVRVEDQRPFRLTFDLNNYQPPSIGALREIFTIEDVNLLGWGDVLTLQYGRSEGLNPLLDFRYAVPVTARDTTVSFEYQRNSNTVVEQPFAPLDIQSTSEIFTLGIRQPVYRTPQTLVAVELIGQRESEKTSILGIPFSLEPGAQNGESVITPLRAVLEVVYRTQTQAIALRSRYSVGINALGATINSDRNVPDGKFFAWLGQFQWARRLPILDSQLILRTDLQIASQPLLTLEQAAVGGRFTVRGYRENTLVRDNAFIGSVEARVPVVQNTRFADYIELVPFFDYGRAWFAGTTTPDPLYLASVGMGLRWALTMPSGIVSLRPEFEVYFGYRLNPVRIVGQPNTLQDVIVTTNGQVKKGEAGIHLQFRLAAF